MSSGFLFGGGGSAAGSNSLPVYNIQSTTYAGGALGNGLVDDRPAIQAAIDAAIAAGGGIVWFPPLSGGSNYYLIGAPLTFSGNNVPVHLLGVGGIDSYGSKINGSFADFIIKQVQPTGQMLRTIQGLSIVNSNPSGSGIRWESAQNGLIQDCSISAALYGIQANNDTYCMEVRNCSVTCPFEYSGVGVHITQGAVHQCSMQGWGVGVQTRNAGFIATGNRIEVCEYGFRLGVNPDGSLDAIQGCTILSNQTERCGVAIDIINCSAGIIAGNTWTGTVGPHHAISGMVWSSSGGGAMTVTTVTPLANWATWVAGSPGTWDAWDTNGETKSVKIEQDQAHLQTGFYTAGFVTATRTGANTFTYAVADPGVAWNGFETDWSFKPQFGMRLRGATGLTYGPNAHGFANIENVVMDLKYDGNISVSGIVFSGVAAGTWLYHDKAGAAYRFENCDNPAQGLLFRDLPGQPGYDAPATPVEGMTFDITDCSTSTFLATANTGGTGAAAHRKVRYNAALPGWQVIG